MEHLGALDGIRTEFDQIGAGAFYVCAVCDFRHLSTDDVRTAFLRHPAEALLEPRSSAAGEGAVISRSKA